jgi:hypothetical protein
MSVVLRTEGLTRVLPGDVPAGLGAGVIVRDGKR